MPDLAPYLGTPIDADPAAWGEMLAAIYRDIGERKMRDLPIFNEALGVAAMGFRRLDGHVVGILITPWFMNVIVGADDGFREHLPGSAFLIRFPAGDIQFTVSEIASAGRIASCSLFSPMFQFGDMASARATAAAALDALMVPHDAGRTASSSIDRRAFLRGTLAERRA